jgi:short-subunit dehydrogenase
VKIIVITGASSGIGREFAKVLSKTVQADEMWLIARREEALKETASLCVLPCRILPLDLTDRDAVSRFQALLEAEKPEIACLVNASGYGKFCAFQDVPLDTYRDMIALNDTSLVEMTYLCLPYMARGSAIYQMGSLSAFQPVPCINVYAATKAFVLSFSRALNVELKPKGICVLCVCPGWVKTAFFGRADTHDGSVTYYNRFTTPEKVVKRAMYDMRRGKDVSIEGLSVRLQVLLTKLLPIRS